MALQGPGTFVSYCLLLTLASAQTPLTVVVLEGQNALHSVGARRSQEPVVYVKDERNRPVPGATVTFVAPASGPGGTFGESGETLIVTADDEGKAVGAGYRPNGVAGPYEIRVTASVNGSRGAAVIPQTNVEAARESGSRGKRIALIAILGGAAVGGLAAALGGSGNGSGNRPTPPAAAPPSTAPAVLTPGAPSVGAP